jgi:SAM-dependent methyltransferase/RimJ/RimL family protein N-acetyltransferase
LDVGEAFLKECFKTACSATEDILFSENGIEATESKSDVFHGRVSVRIVSLDGILTIIFVEFYVGKKSYVNNIVAMSFLHLASTLQTMHAKHVNSLAYRKFEGLDISGQPSLPSQDEEALTISLAEKLDRALNLQGNLGDMYSDLEKTKVFRDVTGKGKSLSVKAAVPKVKAPTSPKVKAPTSPKAKPKPALKLTVKPKIKAKWSPPEYPYHKYYLPEFEVMLKSLLKEKSERDKKGNMEWNMDRSGEHLAIVKRMFPGDVYASDAITDLVVEPVRVSCYERAKTGGNLPSPKDVWEKLLADSTAGGEAIPEKPEDAHEMVYRVARGCNLFNITLGVYLLTGDKNNKDWAPIDALGGAPGDVLDPAAGWGDRLGASFIAGAKSYRGWDTNDKLQPVYNELAKKYSDFGLKLDWNIQVAPFETADLQGAMFDTVITSPPFFDKEIYEGESTSTTVHRGKGGWIKYYYHPMLLKAGGALRPGGRFIAYISDGWMVKEAKEVLEGQLKMSYVGKVGYIQTVKDVSPEPWQVRNAYIWRVPGAPTATVTAPATTASDAFYGPAVYLRLMRAIEGNSKSAGGYNIPDLLELVKFHKPDAVPKAVNRVALIEILKDLREIIRLGPTPTVPEPVAPKVAAAVPESVVPKVAAAVPEPVAPKVAATDVFKLEKLSGVHREDVERLTSDPETMRLVGTGKTWDKRKLDDLFYYAEKDKSNFKSMYVSYVIMYNGRVRGMLQFHPTAATNVDRKSLTNSRLYLTIFIDKDYQRRGLAERALRQAIDELRAERGDNISFGAHIAFSNTASLALHKKLNFKVDGIERIGKREFLALSLTPSASSPPKPKRTLEEKGATVNIIKEPRSGIAMYHSKIKYDVLDRLKGEGVPANPRILDLACGRGGDLFKYKDTFGQGTYIYGVDIDKDAISEAKKRVIGKGARNIRLAVADVSNPKLDTSGWGEPYDIIVCNFAAHYFFKSRESLSSFARLINRYSKKGTIIWIIMPEGMELVRLLIEKGKRDENDKYIIRNGTYNLSSDVEEMKKIGGKVDYKLHGTTYFQTAEPGANIITEGTSHEYFADINTLLEYLGVTAEPPKDYRERYELVSQHLFSHWSARYGRELTATQREISFTNLNTVIRRKEDPSDKPMRDGKPLADSELRGYWKKVEEKVGRPVPSVRDSELDKKILSLIK